MPVAPIIVDNNVVPNAIITVRRKCDYGEFEHFLKNKDEKPQKFDDFVIVYCQSCDWHFHDSRGLCTECLLQEGDEVECCDFSKEMPDDCYALQAQVVLTYFEHQDWESGFLDDYGDEVTAVKAYRILDRYETLDLLGLEDEPEEPTYLEGDFQC